MSNYFHGYQMNEYNENHGNYGNHGNNGNNNQKYGRHKMLKKKQLKKQLSQQDLCRIELYKRTISDIFTAASNVCNLEYKNQDNKLYCNDLIVNQVHLFGKLTYKRFKENKDNGNEYKNECISSLCGNKIDKEFNKLSNKNKELMKPIAETLKYALNGNKLDISKKRQRKNIKANITPESMNEEASLYMGASCDISHEQKETIKDIDNVRKRAYNELNASNNMNNNKLNPKHQPNINSLYNISQTKKEIIFADNTKIMTNKQKCNNDSKNSEDADHPMPDVNNNECNYNNNLSNSPGNAYLIPGYFSYVKERNVPCQIIEGSKNGKYIDVRLALPYNRSIIHKIDETFIETNPNKVYNVEEEHLRYRKIDHLGYTSLAELRQICQ